MTNRRLRYVYVSTATLLLFCGCGNPIGAVPASGRVMYDGQPVTDANILYLCDNSTGESGPSALGRTDASGRYALQTNQYEGAVPGTYVVIVSKDNSETLGIPDPLPPGKTRTDWLQSQNLVPKSVLPIVYADPTGSPLRFEVTTNKTENHFEILLEGEPPE